MESVKNVYIYNIPLNILATLRPRGHTAQTLVEVEDLPSDEDEEYSEEESEVSRVASGTAKLLVDEPTEDALPQKGSPITWFTSDLVPSPAKLGVYTTMLPGPDSTIQNVQIDKQATTSRIIAMFMVGGGHFQGTIISLNESSAVKCAIKASKGFHRYTTRRKQGGAQSANDNAKGAANSAGAQIRRYNEVALAEDVRGLLKDWKTLLDQAEIILVRASGQSSRKLLYDNGLDKRDARIRGFPLNTRRATQSEIVRSFHILTKLQIGSVLDDPAETKVTQKKKEPINAPTAQERKVDPILVDHSEKLTALIKRNKALNLRAHLREHAIDPHRFLLEPQNHHLHAPTLLHFASAADAGACVIELLNLGADPRVMNDTQKTPIEVAGSRRSRDAFRIWRGTEGNEERWDWDAARIPVGLTAEQISSRRQKEEEEKALEAATEERRREEETVRLEREAAEERDREAAELERRRGPARSLGLGVLGQSATASLEGLTPQMRQKIERERRARAAEARFKK